MKKGILIILLCISVALAGCQRNTEDKQIKQTDLGNKITESGQKTESAAKAVLVSTGVTKAASEPVSVTKAASEPVSVTKPASEPAGVTKAASEPVAEKLLTLNNEWSLVKSFEAIDLNYQDTEIKANVPSYTVAKDLSNIENIGQFSGFTKKQTSMLATNGFLVLPGNNSRIYYTYDDNEYKGIPNFVSSDCALHLYHQFYDKSLMSVEAGYLYKDLDLMTKQMLDKSLLLYNELTDEKLKAIQEKNIVYFLTARMLFTQSAKTSINADGKLIDTAQQEYKLCQAAKGYAKSLLIGKDFDYSQFKVRGHYTQSKELGRYFKTMMWFGTAPFAFTDASGQILYDNIYQSLLITFTAFSDSKSTCDAKLWSDIYQPTTQYVGASDDLNVFDINNLRVSVYGDSDNPDIFNDGEYSEKLAQAVKDLPEPRIKASLITLDTPTGKQFRFMGQRYILDSEILQRLIDSNLRPIPSSLDVMGVLGSSTAEKLLFNVYKPQKDWPKYTDRYKELKSQVASYTSDYWKNNLYTGWLWSIQDILTEYDKASKMPMFMTNKAWKYKSLNTALGSYTELKHDSVLYGKQPVAEMGGPEESSNRHYVEPDINLYSKLLYLTDYTLSILQKKGMLNDNMSRGAESYKKFLQLLISCSQKELKNKALSKEEKRRLLWCGGTIEDISLSFKYGALDNMENNGTDMLASDIATCKGTYLSLGTGYFDDIYVVVPVDGKLYLTRGSVYSFYEFTSNTRLTDKEWWALQGIHTVKTDFGEYMKIGEPSKDVPKQPGWVKYFKSDSNHVKIKPLNTDFDNLSE